MSKQVFAQRRNRYAGYMMCCVWRTLVHHEHDAPRRDRSPRTPVIAAAGQSTATDSAHARLAQRIRRCVAVELVRARQASRTAETRLQRASATSVRRSA